MDISNVGGFAAAGKFPKANDNDGDDKGGAKVNNGNAGAQGASASEAQKSETPRPTSPVAKSGEEDNVIQTKTQAKGSGRVNVMV
jgi:hypothetical protein